MPKIKIEKDFYVAILNDVATLIEDMTTECDCLNCSLFRKKVGLFVKSMRELDNAEKKRIQEHF